ncbi:MAG TPA: hypothetical protein VLZ77_03465 [Acidimicrobiales bacterium]|nr:hypothetical protein [Acidimicrobiales bacterium]
MRRKLKVKGFLTVVVFLILAVVWAVVLAPGLIRRKREHRSSGDSVGEFHHHLRVLQRTGPTLVRPAYRLGTALPEASPATGARRGMGHVASRGPGLVLVRPDGVAPPPPDGEGPPTPRVDPYFRPAACRRRRDVLLWMLSAVFASALLGAIPPLRLALCFTALTVVVCAVYVGMLVRHRRRAVERVEKLRYMPGAEEQDSSVVILRSAAR